MSLLKSVFLQRCGKCQQSPLFKNSLVSFKNPLTMNESCPHCGIKFEPEPGFYWGSMYVSYALTSVYCLSFCFTSVFILKQSILNTFLYLILSMSFLFIIFFRVSRALWFYIYAKFEMK